MMCEWGRTSRTPDGQRKLRIDSVLPVHPGAPRQQAICRCGSGWECLWQTCRRLAMWDEPGECGTRPSDTRVIG